MMFYFTKFHDLVKFIVDEKTKYDKIHIVGVRLRGSEAKSHLCLSTDDNVGSRSHWCNGGGFS